MYFGNPTLRVGSQVFLQIIFALTSLLTPDPTLRVGLPQGGSGVPARSDFVSIDQHLSFLQMLVRTPVGGTYKGSHLDGLASIIFQIHVLR